MIASIPEFGGSTDEDFRAGTVLRCQSNLRVVREQLLSGAPTDQVTPPDDAIAWAHELVHRGMEMAALLGAYRLGHGLVEKRFEEAASELDIAPAVRWRVLACASRYMFAYVDAVSHSSSETRSGARALDPWGRRGACGAHGSDH